jgi:hypothetical protein
VSESGAFVALRLVFDPPSGYGVASAITYKIYGVASAITYKIRGNPPLVKKLFSGDAIEVTEVANRL